ncbi:hypothetical protein [uncultured Microscilla sp.]|uniref:metallophosphoesterase family protein n=1 Tax=uncultured Microscilla sp. TaxID=432653 RepID=UPI002630C9AF|nr:hypothetical protein [uncultured Microscilla sp.]
MDDTIRIVQITDPYLLANIHYPEVLPIQVFENILAHINLLPHPPDLLILTSEVLQQRRNDTLQLLQKLDIPFYWVAHEQNTSFNVKGTHFIMLNSCSKNHSQGYLGNDTLDFLQNDLENSWAYPCIVTLHHHPLAIRTLTPPKDTLKDAGQFLSIIDQFYHIKAVLFGHIHHDFMLERNDIWFFASPAICPISPHNPAVVFQYRLLDLTSEGEVEASLVQV